MPVQVMEPAMLEDVDFEADLALPEVMEELAEVEELRETVFRRDWRRDSARKSETETTTRRTR